MIQVINPQHPQFTVIGICYSSANGKVEAYASMPGSTPDIIITADHGEVHTICGIAGKGVLVKKKYMKQ